MNTDTKMEQPSDTQLRMHAEGYADLSRRMVRLRAYLQAILVDHHGAPTKEWREAERIMLGRDAPAYPVTAPKHAITEP